MNLLGPDPKVLETPPSQRKIDLEDRPTLSQAAIEKEARRCANCGCVAVNASDLAPALLALGARIKRLESESDSEGTPGGSPDD